MLPVGCNPGFKTTTFQAAVSVHLQAQLLLHLFILESHSAILILRCRHRGACSLKVQNYSRSVCSYCYKMLCFGALGSAGQKQHCGKWLPSHSRQSVWAGVSVVVLLLLFSVPARWSFQSGLPGPLGTFLWMVCEPCAVLKSEYGMSALAALPIRVTNRQENNLGAYSRQEWIGQANLCCSTQKALRKSMKGYL